MKAHSLVTIITVFVLAACASTNDQAHVSAVDIKTLSTKTADTKKTVPNTALGLSPVCYKQLRDQQKGMGEHSNPAKHIALADRASRCIEGLRLHPKHPDNQKAMQLGALAIVNYIKAGDSDSAERAFSRFRQQFPQQDLQYTDYSSFVDTIIALLNYDTLASHQIRMLNINESMRNELSRQYHWRRH